MSHTFGGIAQGWERYRVERSGREATAEERAEVDEYSWREAVWLPFKAGAGAPFRVA